MGEPALKRATYEDLLQAPDHLIAEILSGELYTHPRPAPKHALSASAIGGKLFDPFGTGSGGPGGWWILDEPELHLHSDIMVPDLKDSRWTLQVTLKNDDRVRVAPFDAIEFSLRDLWG